LIITLKYLTATRSNIIFGVGLLSKFIEESYICHLQGVKRTLCYIKYTFTKGVFYTSNSKVKLIGYINSD